MSKVAFSVPVLTYHAMNVQGNEYYNNDHLALYHDLRLIQNEGKKIVPLAWVVDALLGTFPSEHLDNTVALSFDDGPNHDFIDWTHPTQGSQKSFFTIMSEFLYEYGQSAQPDMQATSFVVASPDARQELDRTCMQGRGWWEDFWWKDAEQSGLISIQSHSWDHLHPTLSEVAQKDQIKGDFSAIDSLDDCHAQVATASAYIAGLLGHNPTLFAYPWGPSSRYIREYYFPKFAEQLGIKAAFSIEPRAVTEQESIWNLPRFVCGSDWHSEQELSTILK